MGVLIYAPPIDPNWPMHARFDVWVYSCMGAKVCGCTSDTATIDGKNPNLLLIIRTSMRNR